MTEQSNKALIVIDLQNDYFPDGKFPLWNTDDVLTNIEFAIESANSKNIPVILVQHIANAEKGIAPFFNKDSDGANIHSRILELAENAEIVVKEFADSFEQTRLEQILEESNINELLICGMMTQNCVTHTAISKKAERYNVSILADCCTSVDQMIHNIALNAVSTRIPFISNKQL
jgi:nicotinamidase-related amidase